MSKRSRVRKKGAKARPASSRKPFERQDDEGSANHNGEQQAVKLKQLCEDTIDLLFNALRMSGLEAELRRSDLAFSMLNAYEQWKLGEWDDVQTACLNGIDLCSIWVGRQYSPIPTLIEGLLYALLGSSHVLNVPEADDARLAVRAFRQSRECMRHMFHATSTMFEAVTCLGLAVAYGHGHRYLPAAHACSQGLALLPHEQNVPVGIEELRLRLKDLWMYTRTLATATTVER